MSNNTKRRDTRGRVLNNGETQLLGHEQLATTMRYLDISTDDQIKAMATLEDENDSKVSAKWKNNNGSLKSLVARQ